MMLFARILRAKKKVKPKLEIRVIGMTPYGASLEATSNFFDGAKIEFFAENDVWIFELDDEEIEVMEG